MTADLFWASPPKDTPPKDTPPKDTPPKDIVISGDEVHVWRASLDQPEEIIDNLRRTLTAAERKRAEGFHFEKDRRAFVVARGVLRSILGRYLGMDAGEVQFAYNAYGKPELAPAGGQAVRFNLSHSGRIALYAVALGREVGIDVECIRHVPKAEQIANRYFAARERADFNALPADQQQEAFFSCWTRKEAYIKARGQGLSLALDQFAVSLSPGEPVTITLAREDSEDDTSWSLRDLRPGQGYAAALAAEGHGWRLQGWQW